MKLPNSVTVIGTDAFRECFQLSNINFPKKLVYIRENAFYGCKSLKAVVLPKSLKGVGILAFGSCESIEKLVVNSNKVYIGTRAFSYIRASRYEEEAKDEKISLHTIQFPKKFYGKLYECSLSSYIGKKFTWIDFVRLGDGISERFIMEKVKYIG